MPMAWAEARAETALRDVFERRTCFYCHTVSKDGPAESPWRIAGWGESSDAHHISAPDTSIASSIVIWKLIASRPCSRTRSSTV